MSEEVLSFPVGKYFHNVIETGRLGSAYLFLGDNEDYKRKICRFLASFLNCTAEARPCFRCLTCRLINKGRHPDVLEFYPEPDSIKIEQIKVVQNKVALKSYLSPYKIVIINQIDRLTQEAANSFLKVLEEPPLKTVFFLTTNKLYNVLATIQSRVQKIYVSFKFSQFIREVSSYNFTEAENKFLFNFLSFCGGYLYKKKLTEIIEKRKVFSSASTCFNIYEEKTRQALRERLILILFFLRDSLMVSLGLDEFILNRDFNKEIYSFIKDTGPGELIDIIEGLIQINSHLDNINLNLAKNLAGSLLWRR